MSALALLRDFEHRGAQFILEGEGLSVSAPSGVLSQADRDTLIANKSQLLAVLRQEETPVFLDFETRSTVKLKGVGSRQYANHADTEVLCLVALLPGGAWIEWVPGMAEPQALFDAIADGVPLVAHNGEGFDRLIWNRLGWPKAQWIDTMFLARVAGLPSSLGGLGELLLGEAKDDKGKTLTLAQSTVNRKTKALPEVTPEVLARVILYCRQDVDLLAGIWRKRLRSVQPSEPAVRDVHAVINRRGFAFDSVLASAVVACSETLVEGIVAQAGVAPEVLRSTQKLKACLLAEGVKLENVQKGTLQRVLKGKISGKARQIVDARLASAPTGAVKLATGLKQVCADGRMRDTLNYHAAHTGRWSGKGFQPQNLPKGAKNLDGEAAVAAALTGDCDALQRLAVAADASDTDVLGSLVRRCIVAPPGKLLSVIDYASIEARVLSWIACDDDELALYRRGEDPYRHMAAKLWGCPVGEVTAEQRQLGKSLVLGCGYQMGAPTFKTRAAQDGVNWSETSVTPEQAVEAWRESHTKVAGRNAGTSDKGFVYRQGGLWGNLETAGYRAIQGRTVEVGPLVFSKQGDDVVCGLPSGRLLVYPDARMEVVGDRKRPQFTYVHRDPRGKAKRSPAFGGSFAENVTQAVSRDLLADALVCLEAAGIAVVLHVHDEVVSEVVSEEEHERAVALMSEAPAWAKGLPVAVEGFVACRYRK